MCLETIIRYNRTLMNIEMYIEVFKLLLCSQKETQITSPTPTSDIVFEFRTSDKHLPHCHA